MKHRWRAALVVSTVVIGGRALGATWDGTAPAVGVPAEARGRPVADIVVVVRGARRTVPAAVRRMMSTRVGQPLSEETLRRDVSRLRATQMLYDEGVKVEEGVGGPRLVLELRDKWSAFVYAGVRRGGARTIARVGVSDNNMLGRLFRVAAEVNSGADIPFVARDSGDRLGSAVHLTMPRLLGTRLSPSISWVREFFDFAAWPAANTPGFIYDRARHLQRAGLRWDVTDAVALAGTATTFSDGYRVSSGTRAPGELPPDGRTTLLGLELQLGDVDEYLSRIEGWQLSMGAEGARRGFLGSEHALLSASVAAKRFVVPRAGHNLCAQLVLAGTTAPTDSHLVRAGGLYELRGFRDATFVAQRMARANLEYRLQVLETERPIRQITQIATFVDLGWIGPRGRAVSGFPYEGPVASAGAGFRVNIVPLARAIGRVDFARTLHPFSRFEISFGVQQFF